MVYIGAELLLYPSSFGTSSATQNMAVSSSKDAEEVVSDTAKTIAAIGHWHRTITGHAAANLVPVIVANLIGAEMKSSHEQGETRDKDFQPLLTFQGSSFITTCTGEIRRSHLATRSREAVLVAEVSHA